METTEELAEIVLTQEDVASSHRQANQVKPVSASKFSFTAQARAFEDARYFWMSVFLTAQSCLGAVACMFILYGGANVFALSACAAVTMGSNAMFIGLASPKVCLGTFYASVILNLVFIIANPVW